MKVFKPSVFETGGDKKWNIQMAANSMGDPSVGMAGASSLLITDAISREDLRDPEFRESQRQFIGNFFEELHDDPHTRIQFDDECPDCGNFLVSTHLKSCIAPPKYAKEDVKRVGSEWAKIPRDYLNKTYDYATKTWVVKGEKKK